MSAAEKVEKLSSPSAGESNVVEIGPSREVLRSRRKREVRARTISVKRMTKREIAIGRALYPEDEHEDVARPKTRGDCADGPRPCPFVSCAHHLYLDVSAKTGAIKLNFPDIEADELELLAESCALDVADRQGVTLEETGAIMNLTRERIRQVEVTALAKVRAEIELRELRDLHGDGGPSKRRLPVLQDEDDEQSGEYARADEDADREPGFDALEFASDTLDSE